MATSHSALPWIWIIEALATLKQKDGSVLMELVKNNPEITCDLGKDAREMVNFRILDTLASSSVRRSGRAFPTPVSENHFDPSERCEKVVERILHERTGEAEMLTLEAQNFIARKRASLPKCTLLKLKDAILEGNQPALASLKGKINLFASHKRGERTAMNGADPNEATGLSDSQTVAEGGNLTSPNAENLNSLSQEDCQNRNLTPSKRNTSHLEIENQALRFHTDALSLDHASNIQLQITKKLKHDASLISQVVGRESPLAVREQPAASVNKLDLDFPDKEIINDGQFCPETGTPNVARPNRVDGKICSEANNMEKSPHNGTHFNNFSNEVQRDKNHNPDRDCSSDSDGYRDERIDIATRKVNFLSSQNTFTQDSLATADCTELNFCMKCEKDGELLVCSATHCPIAVHQSCLDIAPSFDNNGRFFCPFCSYSHAIREYRKIKKKASLIRKDLTVFLGVEKGQRPKQIANVSSGPEHNQRRQDDDVYKTEQRHQNLVTDVINTGNRENIEKAQEVEPSTSNGNPLLRKEISKISTRPQNNEQRQDGNMNRNDQMHQNHVNIAINPPNREIIGDTQQVEPSTSNAGALLDGSSKKSNREVKKLSPECQPAMALERQEAEVHASQNRGNNSSTHRERVIVPMTEKHAPDKNNHGRKTGVAPCSEEEEYGPFSDYVMRSRQPKAQLTYPATPQLRRKKMEWTPEEEEVLKEGVKKFTGDSDKIIQWTTIMEFGSSVFHKGRTAVDLKDKWRNLCKKHSK